MGENNIDDGTMGNSREGNLRESGDCGNNGFENNSHEGKDGENGRIMLSVQICQLIVAIAAFAVQIQTLVRP